MLMKACSFNMLSYCHKEKINMYFCEVSICIIYNLKDKITNKIDYIMCEHFRKPSFHPQVYSCQKFTMFYFTGTLKQFSLVTLNEDK